LVVIASSGIPNAATDYHFRQFAAQERLSAGEPNPPDVISGMERRQQPHEFPPRQFLTRPLRASIRLRWQTVRAPQLAAGRDGQAHDQIMHGPDRRPGWQAGVPPDYW
jgi:hypothetical protein